MSAIRQGQAAKAAADFNAAVSTQNARLVREETELQLRQQDRENYLRLGSARARAGASGGSTSEGSVLDVIGDLASQGELARQNVIYQGAMKERGFLNTATLDTFEGEAALQASKLKAGSELLQGAGGYYNANSRLKRT